MRTKAHAVIEHRYLRAGSTTRIVVLPVPDSGLPADLIEAGQPVTLDLLAGRPVNLELGEAGLAADLCFGGPPQRCRFPWEAVVAAQDASGQLVPTLVLTMAVVMEDESLAAAQVGAQPPPPMTVLDGGRPQPKTATRRRPVFEVIDGHKRDDDDPS